MTSSNSEPVKKIELTVREIDVAKFEPGSKYLVILDPIFFDDAMGKRISEYLNNFLEVRVAVMVVPEHFVKVYGLPEALPPAKGVE